MPSTFARRVNYAPITYSMDRLPTKFRKRISVSPSGCWEWTGQKYSNGYGRFYWAERDGGDKLAHLTHRLSYTLLVAPIQQVINHLCENRACVNPAHLEDVSYRENFRYSVSDKCPAGHNIARGHPNTWVDPKTDKRKCRTCMRERKREEYRANPEARRDRSREYYRLNRKAQLDQKKTYYQKNRERILAQKRESYQKMKEQNNA